MADSMKTAIEQACQMFMYPIAKFLLARGFKYPDFAEVAKLAFVQAGADSELSTSAISSNTGVARRDVARMRDVDPIDVNKLIYSRRTPSAVLSRWHQDKEYLEPGGGPRAITYSGPKGFVELVRRVDADWQAKDCLEKLEEVGAVRRNKEKRLIPTARYYIMPPSQPAAMFHFGLSLRDLACTLDRNLGTRKLRVIEAASYSVPLDPTELPAVRRVARLQGSALLEAFDDWLTAQTADPAASPQNGHVRTSLYVHYYEDDIDDVEAAPSNSQ